MRFELPEKKMLRPVLPEPPTAKVNCHVCVRVEEIDRRGLLRVG
jgi:hypothetical protein